MIIETYYITNGNVKILSSRKKKKEDKKWN